MAPAPAPAPPATQNLTTHLPYKYVVFKNAFPEGDWDQADAFAFDIPLIPLLKNYTTHVHTIGLLPELCSSALRTLQDYLYALNADAAQTPAGCKWVIQTVDIERDENEVLSCREFGVVIEMIGWKAIAYDKRLETWAIENPIRVGASSITCMGGAWLRDCGGACCSQV